MEEKKVRTPTEVITFRITKARFEEVRNESKKYGLNTSALLNQIIDSYFEFSAVAASAGMMPFSKRLLQEMMSELDEKKISNLSRKAAESLIPDLVYMKRNKFTTEAFIDTLLAWARYSGFQYRDTFEKETRNITIQHNMGSKWSSFMMGFMEVTLSKLDAAASFERPDDMVVIHIKNGRL